MSLPQSTRNRSLRAWIATLILMGVCSTAPLSAFDTVIIDAGHGGHDRGGVPGQRVAEKIVALDVAHRLERSLRSRGFQTAMTRRSDVFVSLPQRTTLANRYRNAVFVSIHFNSAPRVGARGFETFYYSANSAGLAARIQRNILSVTRTENRGIHQRSLYVLSRNHLPAVLVECGFLTNPDEAKLAEQSIYRQCLADQIASAISEQRAVGVRIPGGTFQVAR